MVITHFGLILGLLCMVWYVIWFYCMVLCWILFHSIALQCIAWHFIVLYHMALYCIVFDIIAVYCMSPHCILWYGMVFYFTWSYCTVSHCYVSLLQRAGELPRSASSHFNLWYMIYDLDFSTWLRYWINTRAVFKANGSVLSTQYCYISVKSDYLQYVGQKGPNWSN